MIKKIFLPLLFLLLNGCVDPSIFQTTTYEYIMPESENGRYCVNQCISSKNTCEQICQSDRRNCDIISSLRDDGFNNAANQCYNQQTYCSNKCASQYDHCYINCGGRIVPSSVYNSSYNGERNGSYYYNHSQTYISRPISTKRIVPHVEARKPYVQQIITQEQHNYYPPQRIVVTPQTNTYHHHTYQHNHTQTNSKAEATPPRSQQPNNTFNTPIPKMPHSEPINIPNSDPAIKMAPQPIIPNVTSSPSLKDAEEASRAAKKRHDDDIARQKRELDDMRSEQAAQKQAEVEKKKHDDDIARQKKELDDMRSEQAARKQAEAEKKKHDDDIARQKKELDDMRSEQAARKQAEGE